MLFIDGMTAACSSKKVVKDGMKKFASWLLSALIVFNPIMPHINVAIAAGNVEQRTEFGAAQGGELWGNLESGNLKNDQSLKFPDTNQGQMFKDPTTGDEIPMNELFGAKGRSADASARGLYRMNKQEFEAMGKDSQSELKRKQSEITGDGSYEPEGDAYRTLREGAYVSKPDLKEDPMWGSADEVYNIMAGGEPNCTPEDSHEPDYRTCTRLNTGSASCTVYHDYDAGVLKYVSGQANLENSGPGQFRVWLGDQRDDHLSGNCKIFERNISIEMLNVDAIESAVLKEAYWDDYLQVWLGDELIWDGPYTGQGVFPPETSGRCELKTSWRRPNLNVDFTNLIKSYSDGDVLNFKIRVSVSGNGEGYAGFNIKYDQDKVVRNDVWSDTGTANVTETRVQIASGNYNIKFATNSPTTAVAKYDLKNGTVTNELSHTLINSQGATLDYDKLCGGRAESKISTSFVMSSGSYWGGHGLGGRVDDTIITEVIQSPSCENGLVGKVKIRDTNGSNDWDEWRLTGDWDFMYEVDQIQHEGDIRSNCIAKAKRYENTYGPQSWQCAISPAVDANGCATIEGVVVCPDDFIDPPLDGISPLCQAVKVVEPDTPLVSGENSCSNLEENPQCGFISSKCKDKTNRELVTDLYEYGLGRAPDTQGLNYWTSRLDSGTPYDELIDHFFDRADYEGSDYIDKFSCMEFEEVWDCGHLNGASNSGACAIQDDILPGQFADCTTKQVPVTVQETIRIGEVESCDEALQLTECTIERDFVKTPRAISTNWDRGCFDEEVVRYRTPWHDTAISAIGSLQVDGVFADASITQQPSLSNGWTTKVKMNGPGQMVEKTKEVPRTCTDEELDGLTEQEKLALTCTDTVTYETMECPVGTKLDARLNVSGHSLEVFETEYPAEEGNDPCLRESDDWTETTWQCDEQAPSNMGNGVFVSDAILEAAVGTIGEGLPASCTSARAVYETKDYGSGEYCSENSAGEVECEEIGGLPTGGNSCSDLEAREATGECVYEGRYPFENGAGSTGFQYVWEHRYDCATQVETIEKTKLETQYECEGEIRCLGEECMSGADDESEGFEQAVGMLNAVTQMGSDVSCDVSTNGSMDQCQVFNGEALTCKVALGGYKSCCETPGGISLADYIVMMNQTQKLAQFAYDSGYLEPVKGTYNAMKGSVNDAYGYVSNTDTYKAVSEGFSSMADTATGAINSTFGTSIGTGGGTGVIAQSSAALDAAMVSFKQGLMQGADAFLRFLDPSGMLSDMVFQASTDKTLEQGALQLSDPMSNAMSFIGAAYTAYVVANLIIDVVYACTPEEQQVNVDRVLKKTHYIGTYCRQKVLGSCIEKRRSFCAFSSPLARIVNEQARPQLGISWGRPSSPDCSGITLEELTRLDWSQIDLGEWIDILNISGNMPGMDGLGLEKMTGEGSFLGQSSMSDDPENQQERLNTADRNKARLEGSDISGTNRDHAADLWSAQ